MGYWKFQRDRKMLRRSASSFLVKSRAFVRYNSTEETLSGAAAVFASLPNPATPGWMKRVDNEALGNAMEKYFDELGVIQKFEDKIQNTRASRFYLELQSFMETPGSEIDEADMLLNFPLISKYVYTKPYTMEDYYEEVATEMNVPNHLKEDFLSICRTGQYISPEEVGVHALADTENPYKWFYNYLHKWEDDLQDSLDAIEWDFASGKMTTNIDVYKNLEENPTPADLYEIEKELMNPDQRAIMDKLEAVQEEFRASDRA